MLKSIFVFLFVSFLVGCGGGSGESTEVSVPTLRNVTLEAIGPADFSVMEGEVVQLSGRAVLTNSDKPITYSWDNFSSLDFEILGGNTPNASFIAPNVTSDVQVLIGFSVQTEDFTVPPTDFVRVTIINSISSNSPPVANAGSDQSVHRLTEVALTGMGSDIDGSIQSYLWEQINGPILTLSDTENERLNFIAPELVGVDPIELIFEFTVTDNDGASNSDRVTVWVNPAPNILPTIEAGDTIDVREQTEVVLEAMADDVDGLIVDYQWRQIDGPLVQLSISTDSLRFIAPSLIDENTEVIVFEVTAIDNDGGRATDQVTVNVIEYKAVGAILDTNRLSNKILESAGIGAMVGITAHAEDPTESDVITYHLSGDESGVFSIQESSGDVTIRESLNYDSAPEHALTVIARSSDGSESRRTFKVIVLSDDSPDVQVDFPINNSTFTGDNITVRGRINDADLSAALVTVSIGGTRVNAVLHSSGEFIAEDVPVVSAEGYASVNISVLHSDTRTSIANLRLLTNLSLESPVLLHQDEAHSRVLTIDRILGAIVSIDMDTGLHTILFESIYFDSNVNSSSFDTLNEQLYFIRDEAVYMADLVDETITIISDADIGSGAELGRLRGITFDASNNRIFVIGQDGTEIFAIDRENLSRILISGNQLGLGENFSRAGSIVYDGNRNVCYVYDTGANPDRLFSVDVNINSAHFGDREVISEGHIGGGSSRGWSGQLVEDFENNRLFIWEVSANRSYDEISLESYARQSFSARYNSSLNTSIEDARYVDFDPTNNRFLTLDSRLGGLLAFNRDTSDVDLISKIHLSEGRSYHSPRDIVTDIDNNRYFVADYFRSTVWQVDALNGNRTNLRTITNGEELNRPVGIAYSSQNNMIAVANDQNTAISLIDLDNDEHRILSGSEAGFGDNFNRLFDVEFDELNNRLFVLDTGVPAIFSVDLTSGERVIFSGDSVHHGNRLNFISGAYYDEQKFLVASLLGENTQILNVDVETGVRNVIASVNTRASSWAYNYLDDTAYLLESGSIKALDLQTNFETTISDIDVAQGIQLGVGWMDWDEISGNLFLSQRSRKIIVVDTFSGDHLMISK